MKSRWITVAMLLLCSVIPAGSLTAGSRGKSLLSEPPTAGATVSISNFQFGPKVVRIKAGAEVTWQVKEGTHTVTADDGAWESPTLSAGQKFNHTFTKAGTYRYYCSFHGAKGGHDMAGTIVVTK